MKIVAVNTFGGSGYEFRPVRIPEGPWGFDYIKLLHDLPNFLIEVEPPDLITGCYKVDGVFEDISKGVGVMFNLTKCNPTDEARVRAFVKGMVLTGFPYKYLY